MTTVGEDCPKHDHMGVKWGDEVVVFKAVLLRGDACKSVGNLLRIFARRSSGDRPMTQNSLVAAALRIMDIGLGANAAG